MRAPSVTTVAAIAGLALAGFATVRSARPAAPSRPASAGAQAEIARLQRQVEVLAGAVAQLRSAPPTSVAQPALDHTIDPAIGQPTADEPTLVPGYRSFDAPAGISVSGDTSAIAVRNTDPALTGQIVTVTGERDDGARDVLVVVIPPPET